MKEVCIKPGMVHFGAFNSTRRARWVFGDRDSGAYLLKFAWMKITRHTLVKLSLIHI